MDVKSPLYIQIADLLRDKIEKGIFTVGETIPSERELTETYGVNRMTVRKAVSLLVEEGLLIRKQGRGTFVNHPKINTTLDTIQGMGRFLNDMGIQSSTKLLYSGKRKARYKFSKMFHLNPEDSVFQVIRLRLGDGEPFVLEYIYTPYCLIDNIERYDFSTYSIFDIFTEQHKWVQSTEKVLSIIKIHNPQAALLNMMEDEFAFMMEERTYDQSENVVLYTKSYSSSKRFKFLTTML